MPVGLPATATHPGEILVEEFMKPLHITQRELAARLGISVRRVNELCRGRRSVTAETALLLGKVFETTPQFWMNGQILHDLVLAKQKVDLKAIRPYKRSA